MDVHVHVYEQNSREEGLQSPPSEPGGGGGGGGGIISMGRGSPAPSP